jgi:hypothetical protein
MRGLARIFLPYRFVGSVHWRIGLTYAGSKNQEGYSPSPFSFIAQILTNRFCEGTPTRDKTMVGKPCIKPPYMAADLSNPLQDGEKNRSIKTEKRPAAGALNVELVQRAARNLAICNRT